MLPRGVFPIALEWMRDDPVLLLEGPRSVGKSTRSSLTFEERCRPGGNFCFDATPRVELDTERRPQPGTKMRLVLDTGCFRLAIQTAGVEGSPLTIRHRANRVGDQHMIMKLRIQRPAGAMPIPDPEHTLGIHHRSTGVTGSGVRDPW